MHIFAPVDEKQNKYKTSNVNAQEKRKSLQNTKYSRKIETPSHTLTEIVHEALSIQSLAATSDKPRERRRDNCGNCSIGDILVPATANYSWLHCL